MKTRQKTTRIEETESGPVAEAEKRPEDVDDWLAQTDYRWRARKAPKHGQLYGDYAGTGVCPTSIEELAERLGPGDFMIDIRRVGNPRTSGGTRMISISPSAVPPRQNDRAGLALGGPGAGLGAGSMGEPSIAAVLIGLQAAIAGMTSAVTKIAAGTAQNQSLDFNRILEFVSGQAERTIRTYDQAHAGALSFVRQTMAALQSHEPEPPEDDEPEPSGALATQGAPFNLLESLNDPDRLLQRLMSDPVAAREAINQIRQIGTAIGLIQDNGGAAAPNAPAAEPSEVL